MVQPPEFPPDGTVEWPTGIQYKIVARTQVEETEGTFQGMNVSLTEPIQAFLNYRSGNRGYFTSLTNTEISARSGIFGRHSGWNFSTELRQGVTTPIKKK